MLKKRIIPVQLLLNDRLVKTVRFGEFRDVGDPVKSSAVYSAQRADELVFLNIARDQVSVKPLADVIAQVSKVSFMPFAVGGGIRTFEDAAFLIKNGADKVVINSAAYRDKEMITKISDRFGAQAVVVSIDARRSAGGGYVLKSSCGTVTEDITLAGHIRACEAAGAGEFFVQSIDQDGTMAGFDIPLIREACRSATVPVIGCGGSGDYNQLRDAFLETNVSALACGSLFNFSDSNPIRAKAFLSNHGLAFKVV
ncbi:MAG: imidazole glycerol phosphate synthase subunit HisF [Rhodospirillaceae bacterium]